LTSSWRYTLQDNYIGAIMLSRENTFAITHAAYSLWRLPKGAVGRKMRRLLTQVAKSGILMQSFCFDEGYSIEQLRAIETYARKLDESLQVFLPLAAVHRCGTITDDGFGMVSNHYKFVHNIETATVSQLRDMVKAVAVLGESMQAFAASVNKTALATCPTYDYRGLPCSIAPDSQLWVVAGLDKLSGGSGVLEWCYDVKDAHEVFKAMARHPDRFPGLNAHPFLEPVNHCATIDFAECVPA
jgi:hypothetical protein